MSWLYYIVEANVYLVSFYLFFRVFLYNETFYSLNRWFLLLSVIISFLIPILQVGYIQPQHAFLHGEIMIENQLELFPLSTSTQISKSAFWLNLNWYLCIYLVVVITLATSLVIKIFKIWLSWKNSNKHKINGISYVELKEATAAFSFFNCLFIHPSLKERKEVLQHELVHIRQKHSADVILFEIASLICWFNPIWVFIKRDLKLMHEYIADELTTKDGHKHEYAMFLIQHSFGIYNQPLTNQIFNQSIIKRRINMLNKKKTAPRAKLRYLIVLPLIGGMLCTSSLAFTKDYGFIDLLPEKSEQTKAVNLNTNQALGELNLVNPAQSKPNQATSTRSYKPKNQNRFLASYKYDEQTKKAVRLEKRLVVVNGTPISNQNEFYGAGNAESILILSPIEATRKFGVEGKNGAVEIKGSAITFIKKPVFQNPKADQVKFPPPLAIYKTDQKYFTPHFRFDQVTKEYIPNENRYIVVNGTPVEDNSTFYGVKNTNSVIYYNSEEGTKKFGIQAKNGAVVIEGEQLTFNQKEDQFKYPPPVVSQVKFPSPIVKPAGKSKDFEEPPPPIEPHKNKNQVKFPPPIVKPTGKSKDFVEPPPPVEPSKKNNQVKFPPPIVKPAEKSKDVVESDLVQDAKNKSNKTQLSNLYSLNVHKKLQSFLIERSKEIEKANLPIKKKNELSVLINKQIAFVQHRIKTLGGNDLAKY